MAFVVGLVWFVEEILEALSWLEVGALDTEVDREEGSLERRDGFASVVEVGWFREEEESIE